MVQGLFVRKKTGIAYREAYASRSPIDWARCRKKRKKQKKGSDSDQHHRLRLSSVAHFLSETQHSIRHGSGRVCGQKDGWAKRWGTHTGKLTHPARQRTLRFWDGSNFTRQGHHLSCGVTGRSADFSSMDRSSAALHFLNSSGNSRSNVDTNKVSSSIESARSE